MRRLRLRAGLSVRDLAKALHRAHSGIVEYEGGLRLPSLEVVEQYEDHFGLVRGTLVAHRERARVERLDRPQDRATIEDLEAGACPYKGLHAFDHRDAHLFFGRETQVKGVLARLAEARFVAVLGASGSGKSSFARAGLLAGLNAAGGAGGNKSRIAVLTPGERPVENLAAAVTAALGSAAVVSADLRADPDALHRVTRQAGSGGVVIVVDQFEELFTLCRSEADGHCFVDALMAAWRDPASAVVVIIALRADFYGRVATYPELAAAVVAHQALIGPMSSADLLRAIEGPAAQGGLALQPGLAATIVDDLGDEPGALPLLSHALLETWKRRRRLMLTVEGYQEAGGVRGAIAQTAETTLQTLPDADRAIAQSIFLGLTDINEAAEPTRRRMDRSDLAARAASTDGTDRVLGILADARLVSVDENTVEVAHEALVRHWPRLRGWIDADLASLLTHRRLHDAAREWGALNRESAALYRGARLATASEWANDHTAELTPLESDFLTASRAIQQRRARGMRVVAGGLAALAVSVAALAVWALVQRNTARRQATQATSLALASSATALLGSRPDVSLLLALEAYRLSPRVETRSSVIAALTTARAPGLRAILHGHDIAVESVAVSPDGRTLASAGSDATIRLWDLRSHKQIGAPLTGHTSAVQSVAFSPDGRTLASSADDATIRLWDVRTHAQVGAPLSGHTSFVGSVVFSANGRTLASASGDKTVRLWDVATHKQVGTPLTGHRGVVRTVAFSRDGLSLASAGDDRTIRFWDIRTHKQLGSPLTGHTDVVWAVAFSPDGRTLASASADKTLRLWDIASHEQLGAPLAGHTALVASIAYSPDGRTLASGSADKTVRVWDVRAHKQLGATLAGHAGTVRGVAFSRDGRTLATASADKTIRLWDVPRAHDALGTSLTGHTKPVYGVTFSPDGRTLASASADKTIRLWDIATRRQLGTPLTGHTDVVWSVAFSPDGRTLASASYDKTVRLWNVRTHNQLGPPLTGHTGQVYGLAFSPNGRVLASGAADKTIRLWDIASHKQIGASLTGHTSFVNSVAFSPDGRTLASGSGDQTARVWDLASHKQVGAPLVGHTSFVDSVAFSRDGRTLASGSDDPSIRIWDANTHRQLGAPLTGHTGAVVSVAFSPDGRTLASASYDKTVRLWDIASHSQLGIPLTGHTAFVSGVAFSPDGRTLASASDDKTIRLWNRVLWRDFAELQNDVCGLVGSGLSRTEWAQYAPGISYRQSCP